MSNRPLKGVRVLEMGTLIAGPFCTKQLAEFGAEVIKVEAPEGGDPLRVWGQSTKEGHSLWWSVQSRNKKSVTIDLRKPEGQELIKRLVKDCDILVENFRPGQMEKWGLGYEDLEKINPGLIMVRISGFGQTGPYRNKAGFGSVAEGMGGIRYLSGYPDRPPSRIGISIGDSLAALYGVIGAMMALYQRKVNKGRGQVVDVALYEAVFALMESSVPEFDKLGYIRKRTGSILPNIVPSNVYDTKDGNMIIIGANNDNIFRRLTKIMNKPELADMPEYSTHLARGERQEELDDIVNEWTKTIPIAELQKMLDDAGVPAGPIYNIADILNDPHYSAREMVQEVEDPVWGPLKHPGIVPKLSLTPGKIEWAGPGLGEHNREVFQGLLGMTDDEFEKIKSIIEP